MIELLVTIAIISILGALLLPALSDARGKAVSMQCWSNLRQLFMANTMYSSEWFGHYVPAAQDINLGYGGTTRWHGKRETADASTPFNPRKGPLAEYLPDAEVKKCPSFDNFRTLEDTPVAYESGTGGYGYNMAYIGGTHYRNNWMKAPEISTLDTSIALPGETIMFADAAMLVGTKLIEYSFVEPPRFVTQDFPKGNPSWGFAAPSLHFRHNYKVNVVWADGHVSSEPFGWSPDFNIYGGFNRRYALGWFGPKNNRYFDCLKKGGYPPG